jgi:hypothetical protein
MVHSAFGRPVHHRPVCSYLVAAPADSYATSVRPSTALPVPPPRRHLCPSLPVWSAPSSAHVSSARPAPSLARASSARLPSLQALSSPTPDNRQRQGRHRPALFNFASNFQYMLQMFSLILEFAANNSIELIYFHVMA